MSHLFGCGKRTNLYAECTCAELSQREHTNDLAEFNRNRSTEQSLQDEVTALRSSLDAAKKENAQHLKDIEWVETRIRMDDSGAELLKLKAELDAANRALAEEQKRNKQHLIDINWLEERISMDDSGAALVEAQEALTEVRAQLAAAEKMKCFWPKGCSDSARCKENGSCVAQDQRDGFRMQRTIDAAVKLATPDVESLKAQLTEVRAKLEAAEKEIAGFKANNRYMRGHTAGYAEGAADLTAAQADVARLTKENEALGPMMERAQQAALLWKAQLTAAASREAALVEALKRVEAYLADACDHGVLDLSREFPLWELVTAALARCSPPATTFGSNQDSAYAVTPMSHGKIAPAESHSPDCDSLDPWITGRPCNCRYSPPAAETEGQG